MTMGEPVRGRATNRGARSRRAAAARCIAVEQRRPAHGRFWIRGLDGQRRRLEVTAIPLLGQADRHLGAAAIFWEATDG